jgi:hypothetical protein
VAPGSQERVFLDEEESDLPTDSQTVKRVETAWLGAPKAAEGCQDLPTTGY